MKKLNDPRHVNRQMILQALYSNKFVGTNYPNLTKNQEDVVLNILTLTKKIDAIIDTYALTFTHDKMSKIDYCILQLGLFELFFAKNPVPYKVVIDECVELAKEFGSEKSSKLINGILAKSKENEPKHS